MTDIQPTAQPRLRTPLAVVRLSRTHILTLLGAVALFSVFTALFAFVQFSTPGLTGSDGYYHIRMGALVRTYGLRVPFPWLPMSILNPPGFYDHHMLFHAYLALFATGSETSLILGAKLASIIMPSLAFLAIWWLLRGQRVRWASIWALGLFAVSQAFLYRMSMPRAQSASLLILALGLHALLQRKHHWLIPIGFAYVWAYDGFPLLLAMGAVYAVAAFATERRVEWKALVYPAIGVALGLLLNPYSPENITFILNHVLPKVGDSTISVGNEWSPYQTWTLVENSGSALAAFLIGVLALGWRGRRIDRPTLTALGLSIVFGFLLFKARRFVEYFPAFALIFAALSAGQSDILSHHRLKRFAPIGLAAILIAPLTITLAQARAAMIDQTSPVDTYAAAAHWLRDNTPAGSLIFQTDWDDFPRLFFYDTANTYTIGLDPTYMQLYDAKLYDEWVQITQGKVDRPSREIKARFGGSYVMTDLAHSAFLKKAQDDPGLKEVYRDNYAVLFAVVP